MEMTMDISYDQLIDAVKKLPAAKLKQLKAAISEGFIQEKAAAELSDFQSFLLSGPVMDATQHKQHQADRKHFNSWRTKRFILNLPSRF